MSAIISTWSRIPGTDILDRVVESDDPTLPREAAEYFLTLDFRARDIARMNELSELARAGTLLPEQREELENFNRISHLIALLQSKARQSMARRAS